MPLTHHALRAAARDVTVPGAPLTLKLGRWFQGQGTEPRVGWYFDDPGLETDVLFGVTTVRGDAEQVWTEVQLDAAWVFKQHTDSDWIPGVPLVRRRWRAEEAWQALLQHLGDDDEPAVVTGDEVRGRRLTLRGVTPLAWAAYLNEVSDRDPEPGQHVVPAGMLPDDGLPSWAADDLDFGFGDVHVLELVDGELSPRR